MNTKDLFKKTNARVYLIYSMNEPNGPDEFVGVVETEEEAKDFVDEMNKCSDEIDAANESDDNDIHLSEYEWIEVDVIKPKAKNPRA